MERKKKGQKYKEIKLKNIKLCMKEKIIEMQ